MFIGLYIKPSLKKYYISLNNLLLDWNWQLFTKVLSMSFRFVFSLNKEFFFLLIIVICTSNWIKFISFPISLRCFSFHNFIVCFYFYVMIYNILICYDIVFTNRVLFLILIFFTLKLKFKFKRNLLVGWEEDAFLGVGNDVTACQYLKLCCSLIKYLYLVWSTMVFL